VDWRYRDLQAQTGVFWPVVNLCGIHLFPTVLVYLGCLAMWPALTSPTPFGLLDVIAAIVTLVAVVVEMVADLQRKAYTRNAAAGGVLESGLWAWSRHPNYLGEIGFWCGLFLFAVATGWQAWWTLVGPAAMIALFLGISIPMIERRQVARRPEYAALQKRVPVLFPWKIPTQK
jgi:steroid 5-alpha reductase family enzyme